MTSHKTRVLYFLRLRLVAKNNSSPQSQYKILLPPVLVLPAPSSVPKGRKISIPHHSPGILALLFHKILLPRILFPITLSRILSTVECLLLSTRPCKTLVREICPRTNKSPPQYGLGYPLNHRILLFLRTGRQMFLHVLRLAPRRDNGRLSNVTPVCQLHAESIVLYIM